jgi:hypothetical protein
VTETISDLEIKVATLEPRAGDILVCQAGCITTIEARKLIFSNLREILDRAGHRDVTVLVMDSELSLEIVRKVPSTSSDQPSDERKAS